MTCGVPTDPARDPSAQRRRPAGEVRRGKMTFFLQSCGEGASARGYGAGARGNRGIEAGGEIESPSWTGEAHSTVD
jgi:hypothetical protein